MASAKVGLGVGIPLAALCAVLAVLLIMEKRKSHSNLVVEAQKAKERNGHSMYELGQGTQPFELPSG